MYKLPFNQPNSKKHQTCRENCVFFIVGKQNKKKNKQENYQKQNQHRTERQNIHNENRNKHNKRKNYPK